MKATDLLDSLVELRTQLEMSDNIDESVLQQARELDVQMHQMIKSNELQAEESLSDKLIALEAEFSAEHPTLEAITRRMVEHLSQMGI